MANLPLCEVCTRHLKGDEEAAAVDTPYKCALCFGMLDASLSENVVSEVCFT